jgi:hypothetical protein
MTNKPKDPELEQPAIAIQPDYIRLPKWGARCQHTGLTRSCLDLLTRPQPANDFRPPVRSKILKMTGQKSGIKLIDYRSLRIYLDGLPDASRNKRKGMDQPRGRRN